MSKHIDLKLVLKIIAGLLLLFIVYELNRTFSLYYPDHLFEYEVRYRNFNLYSDRPVSREFFSTMEEVTLRMNPVDMYDPEETHNVYLVHDRELFASFAERLELNPSTQGLTINPLGYIMVNLTAIRLTGQIYTKPYPYTLLQADTTYVISHELMHVLTTQKLGFISSWNLPEWKREGYAEYGASLYARRQDSTYSLRQRVGRYLDGYYDSLSDRHRFYIRSGMVVEYLLDKREMGFEDLISFGEDPDTLFRDMVAWKRGAGVR